MVHPGAPSLYSLLCVFFVLSAPFSSAYRSFGCGPEGKADIGVVGLEGHAGAGEVQNRVKEPKPHATTLQLVANLLGEELLLKRVHAVLAVGFREGQDIVDVGYGLGC